MSSKLEINGIPWRVADYKTMNTGDHVILSAGDNVDEPHPVIASVVRRKGYKQHAQLIAAAPELYEALQQLADECDEYVRINNLHNGDGTPATTHSMLQARAALAKVRGEP